MVQRLKAIFRGLFSMLSGQPKQDPHGSARVTTGTVTTQPQASARPATVAINIEPQTLDDAIAYVRMGQPSGAADQIIWYETCTKLRKQYKTLAIDELNQLLNAISANSGKHAEEAITAALIELGTRAPVHWTLDNKYMSIHSDGSHTYRLIAHEVTINPSGAFAVLHGDGSPWVVKPSGTGSVFVSPP